MIERINTPEQAKDIDDGSYDPAPVPLGLDKDGQFAYYEVDVVMPIPQQDETLER